MPAIERPLRKISFPLLRHADSALFCRHGMALPHLQEAYVGRRAAFSVLQRAL
jgi:hypothetical protein